MSIPDARTFADAPPGAPDASLPPTGDGGLGGLTCQNNSDCTNAGECCYPLFMVCGPGTVDPVFGCLPE